MDSGGHVVHTKLKVEQLSSPKVSYAQKFYREHVESVGQRHREAIYSEKTKPCHERCATTQCFPCVRRMGRNDCGKLNLVILALGLAAWSCQMWKPIAPRFRLFRAKRKGSVFLGRYKSICRSSSALGSFSSDSKLFASQTPSEKKRMRYRGSQTLLRRFGLAKVHLRRCAGSIVFIPLPFCLQLSPIARVCSSSFLFASSMGSPCSRLLRVAPLERLSRVYGEPSTSDRANCLDRKSSAWKWCKFCLKMSPKKA